MRSCEDKSSDDEHFPLLAPLGSLVLRNYFFKQEFNFALLDFGRQSLDLYFTVLKFGIRSRLSCNAKALSFSPWYFALTTSRKINRICD